MTGQSVRWLRDNLNFFKEAKDVGENLNTNEFLSGERPLKLNFSFRGVRSSGGRHWWCVLCTCILWSPSTTLAAGRQGVRCS